MKNTLLRRTAFALLVFSVSMGASAQGLYWESTSSANQGSNRIPAKSYAAPKMFKNVDGDRVIVVRLDREKLYSLDAGKKTYWEMTFAEIEGVMKKASAQMEQIQKQMQNLPPDQRKMMEDQMGKGMTDLMASGGKVDLTATNEQKTVNGYRCTKYVASYKKNVVLTAWATNEVKGFAPLRGDWAQFNRRLLSLSPATSMGLAEAMQKIDGFPMELTAGGNTMLVTKVEQRAIPPAEFDVPAGFVKETNPLLQAPAGR